MSYSSTSAPQAVPPCMCNFISAPLSDYRRKVFQECAPLFENLSGDVLDVGCGIAGVYWSLAYIHKLATLSFLDSSTSALDAIREQLAQISPEMVDEQFSSTLEELEKKLTPKQGWIKNSLAEAIVQKASLVIEADFLRAEIANSYKQQFDGIVAIQSLQCVNSYHELVSACTTAKLMLRSSGQLIGLTLRYPENSTRIQTLIDHRYEGKLNPNPMNLAGALDEAGFAIKLLKTVPVSGLESHNQIIFFHAVPR